MLETNIGSTEDVESSFFFLGVVLDQVNALPDQPSMEFSLSLTVCIPDETSASIPLKRDHHAMATDVVTVQWKEERIFAPSPWAFIA